MTPTERQLYLEQEVRIDRDVESEPVFNKLYWTPGRFDLISDKPSEKFIEYLETQIERVKNEAS